MAFVWTKDLYVIGQKHQQHNSSSAVDDEIDFLVNGTNGNGRTRHTDNSSVGAYSDMKVTDHRRLIVTSTLSLKSLQH